MTTLTDQQIQVAGRIISPAVAISAENVADALGISRTAVFWLLKKKHLPSFKIGRRRLIRVSAMEELAKKLEAGDVEINLTEDRVEG